ncbi:MAG TPA: DUF3050 domain-containing protein [Polyangiaceae bacterium]|nr:DUF3050 domain-containing protein [Polyangiaceae bacterium]
MEASHRSKELDTEQRLATLHVSRFDALDARLARLRSSVARHPVYSAVDSVPTLRIFMESHVFAVWDFMSLLKRLQSDLTCVTVPWAPRANARAARLVNQLVTSEECDDVPGFGVISHFDLYLLAMQAAGAAIDPVKTFVGRVARGEPVAQCLRAPGVPAHAAVFVGKTLGLAQKGKIHEVAAAFLFGRESLVPRMFRRVLERLPEADSTTAAFRMYLERHIELDAGEHSQLAAELLVGLCGNTTALWDEAETAARGALAARRELWDGTASALPRQLSKLAQPRKKRGGSSAIRA